MLVLSRKVGESFTVGDGVTVTVVEIGSGRIRLGIEARADIKIVRSELIIQTNEISSGDHGECPRS